MKDETVPLYLDPAAPIGKRADALIGQMAFEQKLSCLRGVPEMTLADGFRLPAVDNDGREALHGVGMSADATLFPQSIGLGATWDPGLLEEIGAVVAAELRAGAPGVWCAVAPVADLRTNPLAGRFEEGFGEDSLLCGALSTAYAFGLKGRDPRTIITLPQIKHVFGYNHEWNRHRTSSSMGVRAMHEYHLAAFKAPIEAGAALGAMAAVNLVNGVPALVHPVLDLIRSEWAPDGFMFIPDGNDITNMLETKGAPYDTWERSADARPTYPEHWVEADADEALQYVVAAMLKAGLTYYFDGTDWPVEAAAAAALETGLLGVSVTDLDRVVRDWLTVLLRTGALDPEPNPAPALPSRAATRDLALRAARDQLVLLKNDGLLPLDPAAGRLAVIGPLADANLRDYYSPAQESRVTPLAALTDRLGADRVDFNPGLDVVAWEWPKGGTFIAVADDGALTAGAPDREAAAPFLAYDWGNDQCVFRHVDSGRFVEGDDWSFENTTRLHAVAPQLVDTASWFTSQNLHRRAGANGTIALCGIDHIRTEAGWDRAYVVQVETEAPHRLSPTMSPTEYEADPGRADLIEHRLTAGTDTAAATASAADYAVVIVGSHPLIHAREGFDRPDLDLAPQQADLARAVARARPGRTVLVVVSGYPLALGDLAEDPAIAAIVYTSHAGEALGTALADALFGACAPAGRLPFTWLGDTSGLPQAGPLVGDFGPQTVDMLEYDLIAAGLTYQYDRSAPEFPFGHGLTYGDFEYGSPQVAASWEAAGPLPVELEVRNAGAVASDEVVQVYARALDSAYGEAVPRKRLVAFHRERDVQPGERRRVALHIAPETLSLWDASRSAAIVESGRYEILIGRSSEDVKLRAMVDVHGEEIGVLGLREAESVWERASAASGTHYWEVSRERTLARAGRYHSVASRRPGAHVRLTKVDLNGATGIELRTATTTASWADLRDPTIEVRTDGPDGPLLGVVPVPLTGDRQRFSTATGALEGAAGARDLYFVFKAGGIYLDTIRLL